MTDSVAVTVPGLFTDGAADANTSALVIYSGLLLVRVRDKGLLTDAEISTLFDSAVAIARGSEEQIGEVRTDKLVGALEQGRRLVETLLQTGESLWQTQQSTPKSS